MPGKFITLEGIEGSGKSLQASLLAEELKRRQVPFLLTHQPGGTSFGRELREVLLNREGPGREPMSELLLYLADRYQHLQEVIEPALTRGEILICDRYHDATLAYQGYARGIGLDVVARLSGPLQLRTPDLTLILDLEVETGLSRARERNRQRQEEGLGRFESEGLDFHARVREGYRVIASREPGRVLLLDASGTPQPLFQKILAVLEQRGMLNP